MRVLILLLLLLLATPSFADVINPIVHFKGNVGQVSGYPASVGDRIYGEFDVTGNGPFWIQINDGITYTVSNPTLTRVHSGFYAVHFAVYGPIDGLDAWMQFKLATYPDVFGCRGCDNIDLPATGMLDVDWIAATVFIRSNNIPICFGDCSPTAFGPYMNANVASINAPEPSSWLLLASGMGMLGVLRRKRSASY